MTDTDAMVVSLVLNVLLIIHNYILHKRFELLARLFAKTVSIISAIADGKAMPKRDSKGEIHIKDLSNETN